MTLQSRFHFLNLWSETPNQSEGTDEEEKEGTVREHQSANQDASKWRNEHSVSGKCVFLFVFLHVGSELGGFIDAVGSDQLLGPNYSLINSFIYVFKFFPPISVVPLNVFIPSRWQYMQRLNVGVL